MKMTMDISWWSKYDSGIAEALKVFPQNLEGEPLSTNEFSKHFKVFYGRPVQDIVEALRYYGEKGYLKAEIELAAEYLEHGKGIRQITTSLNALRPAISATADATNGLGESVYLKVVDKLPLTLAEVGSLPDVAKSFLLFNLSGIDRDRLRVELAIYNDNTNIHPSRLEKYTEKEPAIRTARVSMEGPDRRFVRIIITHYGEFTISKLQYGGGPYNFMHYLFELDNAGMRIESDDVQKVSRCEARKDLTALVGDCGFNKPLKDAFFPLMKSGELRFRPIAEINIKQLRAIEALSKKLEQTVSF